jgi:hypothetical protein
MTRAAPTDSAWRLRADLTTAKLLIWAASVGRDATLTPETHLFLADRYDRLAHIYRMRGRHAKARGLSLLAAEHHRAGGWNGPPFAAAMAMPRPAGWVRLNVVGHQGSKISSVDVA